MTRVRMGVADWLRTTRVPLVLLAPIVVVGAILWCLAASIFLAFMVGVPVVTVAVLVSGVGALSGWEAVGLVLAWAVWWPAMRLATAER
jgi:hypothetical protein